MAIPLRKGAAPAVLSFLREVVGFLALASLAWRLDRGKRPPLSLTALKLCAVAGLMSAVIRLTIIAAVENAGPSVTASISPFTPVITLVGTLVTGTETLRVHDKSGEITIGGLLLCTLSAASIGLWRGPLLFGAPATGAHAPANIPLGASFMLLNCIISAAVQLVNKLTLALVPLLTCTALVEAFAVVFLALFAAASVPASSWWIDGSVVAAVLFGGLLATALNNVLLARANKRLGPLVANMYVPCQPVFTAILDYIVLGDAFYLANLFCGVGVISGLLLVKYGRVLQLQEVGREHRQSIVSELGEDADQVALIAATERVIARRRSSVRASTSRDPFPYSSDAPAETFEAARERARRQDESQNEYEPLVAVPHEDEFTVKS